MIYEYQKGVQDAYGQGRPEFTQVFISTQTSKHKNGKPNTGLRYAMFNLTYHMWMNEKFCHPIVMRPCGSLEKGVPFQRNRRMRADELSHHPIYILSDDDAFVLPNQTEGHIIRDALAIMNRHPEFAILAFWPVGFNLQRWQPANYAVYEDDEVLEHDSVGIVRMCRRGIVKEWPPIGDGPGYDAIHCQAVRDAGYRVGFMKLKCLHLGEGTSTVYNNRRLEASRRRLAS